MDAKAPRGLLRYFDGLNDPRRLMGNYRHRLSDLLAIAILAVLCGAQGWADIAHFGRCKLSWLKTFLSPEHGVPSDQTFSRVFALLDPDSLERCFLNWTQHLAEHSSGKLIAIDGKTIRRSFDGASKKAAIHMVSAWCQTNHLVLGQLATFAKSNEITAIPKLLELLDLTDAVVTIDAMGCQKAIAQQIVDQGGDYVLGLKGNQGTLHQRVKRLLDEAIDQGWAGVDHGHDQTIEKGHGRIDLRQVWATDQIDWVRKRHPWPGLRSVVCVESQRTINGQTSTGRRYYITSLDAQDARRIAQAIRSHWSIENSLHWSLDVTFGEDDSRIRQDHGAQNFSRLRRIALNLLKKDQTRKVGLKGKMKACGWDHDYLLTILTGATSK